MGMLLPTLAGLVPAPTRYSPHRHPENAIARRSYVLFCLLYSSAFVFAFSTSPSFVLPKSSTWMPVALPHTCRSLQSPWMRLTGTGVGATARAEPAIELTYAVQLAQGLPEEQLRKMRFREVLKRVAEALELVNLEPRAVLSKLIIEDAHIRAVRMPDGTLRRRRR